MPLLAAPPAAAEYTAVNSIRGWGGVEVGSGVRGHVSLSPHGTQPDFDSERDGSLV